MGRLNFYGLPLGKRNRVEFILSQAGMKAKGDELHKLIELPYEQINWILRKALAHHIYYPRRKIFVYRINNLFEPPKTVTLTYQKNIYTN